MEVYRQRVVAGTIEQLADLKQHAVQRWIRTAVIKRVDDASMQGSDDAALASNVSWRAWVARGVRELHPHAVADAKTRARLRCGRVHLTARPRRVPLDRGPVQRRRDCRWSQVAPAVPQSNPPYPQVEAAVPSIVHRSCYRERAHRRRGADAD